MAQSGTYHFPAVGESNYVKLFDGTLIQWGIVSGDIPSNSAYSDQTVTFPVPFHESTGNPCVVIGISALGVGATDIANICLPMAVNLNVTSTMLTQFTWRLWKQASVGASANNPKPVASWVALGRWKA